MDNKTRYYTINLTAAGPIFIGSGEKLMKKEYIFEENNKKVIIPDFHKMYLQIKKDRYERDFNKYVISGNKEYLAEWLRNYKYKKSDYDKWTKYELDCGDALIEKGVKPEILTFVKDPYHKPYIPGSSIKGLLRTILLNSDILQNNSFYHQFQRRISESLVRSSKRNYLLKNEISDIESTRYNCLDKSEKKSDAVNDMMSCFVVSDSRPLDETDLVLCQKIDMKQDGTRKPLPILRECLKPGTEIEFDLCITRDIGIDDKTIMQAVNQVADLYYNTFISKFKNAVKQKENTVWLGGGVGFHNKTVINSVFSDNYEKGLKCTDQIMQQTLSKNYKIHKHFNDIRNGVSPHILKVTKCNKKLYQMGMARIMIEEKF